MRRTVCVCACFLMLSLAGSSQMVTPGLPLGTGRPDVAGITRTTLKDDAKVTVTRVHFAPGASEPVHTHPYDIVLVPVIAGPVDWIVAGRRVTPLGVGDVQFVPRDVAHQLRNTGPGPVEIIAIAAK